MVPALFFSSSKTPRTFMTTSSSRFAVVTGASRGIGEACAKRLAKSHEHVLLLARTASALDSVASLIESEGGSATAIPCDLSDMQGAQAIGRDILDEYGLPTTLVLNAGYARDASLIDGSSEGIEKELGVNYLAPTGLLRTFLPRMRSHPEASLIAVGSLTALLPFPGNATYSASKAALFSMMRSLHIEHLDDPVHIGVVLPGLTKTQMTQEYDSALPIMEPEVVAQALHESIEKREWLVIPGVHNRLAASLFGAFPRLSTQILDTAQDLLLPKKRSQPESA